MDLVLVRHGPAEIEVENDADRPLTKVGAKKIKRVSSGIRAMLKDCERIRICSSPLLRAWQTAEILADRFNIDRIGKNEFLALGGDIQPLLTEWLEKKRSDALIIVSHDPFLTDWSTRLTNIPLPFKKGAAAGYKIACSNPIETELRWFMQPSSWAHI